MDLSLETRAKSALEQRLNSAHNYTAQEIAEVGSLERKLFPSCVIDKETTEVFRRLCVLSNIKLVPSSEIRSHRKFIGPVIVAVKKLSYPMIRVHLKGIFEALEEFCAWSLYAHARGYRAEMRKVD